MRFGCGVIYGRRLIDPSVVRQHYRTAAMEPRGRCDGTVERSGQFCGISRHGAGGDGVEEVRHAGLNPPPEGGEASELAAAVLKGGVVRPRVIVVRRHLLLHVSIRALCRGDRWTETSPRL